MSATAVADRRGMRADDTYERSCAKKRECEDDRCGLVAWLGGGGVEHEGETVVVDPLRTRGATFAASAPPRTRSLPPVLAASVARPPGWSATCTATTPTPTPWRRRSRRAPWSTTPSGGAMRTWRSPRPSTSSARPSSSDGGPTWDSVDASARSPSRRSRPSTALGDPQVSWLVEAGDAASCIWATPLFHGGWWQMARRAGPFDVVLAPINGAVVDFPHQQPASPLPAAMVPEQAALAGELLGAGTVIPMHYGGFVRATTCRSRTLGSGSRRPRAGGPTAPPRSRRARRSARTSRAVVWCGLDLGAIKGAGVGAHEMEVCGDARRCG